MGFWRELPKRHYFSHPCIPVIETKNPLKDVLPLGLEPEPFKGLTEVLSASAVHTFLTNDARATNDSTMLLFLERMVKSDRVRGRATKEKQAAAKEWEDRTERMQKHVNSITLLRHWSRERASSRHATSSPTSQSDMVSLAPTYTHAVETWGRSYGRGLCFQNFSRRVRGAVCGVEVQDWDISNCMFTLMTQVAQRLGIDLEVQEVALPMWNRYASDTKGVRSQVAAGFGVDAKAEILKVGHGGSTTTSGNEEVDNFLAGISREARLLRWLAASMLPQAHKFFTEDLKKYTWPENTVFHYFWTTIENQCLRALVGYVTSRPIVHLSLHFDGVLVDAARATCSSDFGAEAEAVITQRTGYRVSLVRKMENTFFEFLHSRTTCSDMVISSQDSSVLMKRGKSLPLALAHATGEYALFSEAAGSNSRTTYEQWSTTLATVQNAARRHLQPCYGLQIAAPGNYVLHAHCSGQPECMAIVVELSGYVRLYDGNVQRSVKDTEMQQAWATSTDRSTVVTFAFGSNPATEPACILLKLSVSQ